MLGGYRVLVDSETEIPLDALKVGEQVFDDWLDENLSQISDMGGCDSQRLLALLWTSWWK